jgi:hypothetical protein
MRDITVLSEQRYQMLIQQQTKEGHAHPDTIALKVRINRNLVQVVHIHHCQNKKDYQNVLIVLVVNTVLTLVKLHQMVAALLDFTVLVEHSNLTQ